MTHCLSKILGNLVILSVITFHLVKNAERRISLYYNKTLVEPDVVIMIPGRRSMVVEKKLSGTCAGPEVGKMRLVYGLSGFFLSSEKALERG